MRIHFQQTGGFAGMASHQSSVVEAEKLPPEEARELQNLVAAADVPTLATQRAGREAATRPDAFQYQLIVEDEGGRHTVEVSDTDMPASVRPLIKWLRKQASRTDRT